MAESPLDEVLLHPVRMRILVALAGRALTPGQLRAELTDVPQATLYQHLARMTRAGILRVVEERPARGAIERVYALSPAGSASRQTGQMDAEHLTPENVRRYYATFIAALLADGARYLNSPDIDMRSDGFGFHEVVFNLTDEELRAFLKALNAAIKPYIGLEPTVERRRRTLATILIPQAIMPDEGASPPADQFPSQPSQMEQKGE